MVEQAAADEIAVLIALQLEVAAIDQKLRTLCDAAVDQALDARLRFLGDERTHIGLVVGIGADSQAFDLRNELFDETVCRLLTNRNRNGNSHAALAGRTVTCAHQRVYRLVEIGIRHDDHVVLRTAEALRALAVHGGRAIDVTGDRRRADEGDRADIGIGQNGVDSALVAVDDVQDAGRKTGFDHQFGKTDRQRRVALGRLEDEGVAAGNCGREHPHRDHAGEVERRNARADANRLADRVHVDCRACTLGEFALLQMRNAADEFADFEAAHDIALGIFNGLAMLAGEQHRQLVHVAVQKFDELEENAGATLRVGGGPFRLRGLGAFYGGAQFGVACKRDSCLNFAGGRVVDIRCAAAGARHMLAVNEMTNFLHGFSSRM